jgi:hypothetical protein
MKILSKSQEANQAQRRLNRKNLTWTHMYHIPTLQS